MATPTTIQTATGETKTLTALAQLAIPNLPTEHARTGQLLSLGKLCDNDCTAHLDKHKLIVKNKVGQQILHGDQEPTGARLWGVNIAPPTLGNVTHTTPYN